jgi:hypothetical protein
MPRGVIFWVLMIIWAIFAVAVGVGAVAGAAAVGGNAFLLFVLFALLGWQVFGPVVR